VDTEHACGLYRKYASDLAAVIDEQGSFTAPKQLDDIEAELTYLRLRELRPGTVMELGTFHGWSTTWILRALRDNGIGHLHSFDRVDHVVRNVPDELAAGRWTFTGGNVQDHLGAVPRDLGYLFVDADHGRRFGRWYLEHLFPLLPAGTPVSVHDVFHRRRARMLSEGAEVVRWLDERGVPLFTAARRHAPEPFAEINRVRAELGVAGARGTTVNPMIWFSLPARPKP
jgi:predicted O-methyltransferase YrrM